MTTLAETIEDLEAENDELQALLCAVAFQAGKPLVIPKEVLERGKQAILIRVRIEGGIVVNTTENLSEGV